MFDRIKKDKINNNENVINIKITLNLVYILIKIFDFKKRENKKSYSLKKKSLKNERFSNK